MTDYELLDSGGEKKLERFGKYCLIRPCPQAVWRPKHDALWGEADALFSREKRWVKRVEIEESWEVKIGGVRLSLSLTDFGHLGVFPEHAELWHPLRSLIEAPMKILNLFAYSGGASLAAAQEGAEVCHLDASKGMVDWGKKNAKLNQLQNAPIRWIVDDAMKFLKREIRRGSFYDGILLDPPTFGRGAKGEVFKIERDLIELLDLCHAALSKKRRFLLLSCHTPGITSLVLKQTLAQVTGEQGIDMGELRLSSPGSFIIPSGCYAIKTY